VVNIPLHHQHGPFATRLDPERIARYATATDDPNPGCRNGTMVPPAFLAMLAFEVQAAAFAAIPPEVVDDAGARVHGEHDLRLLRALSPGETVQTTAELTGVRPNRAGTVVVQRFRHHDDADGLIAEQWWSLFLGAVQLDAAGDAPPDHGFPSFARNRHLARRTVPLELDVPKRYAEVSGDWSAHHFDTAAARRSGARGPFLHGLCALALCAQAVTEQVAGGDPTLVRRVAVRFAAPALVGEALAVDLFDAGDGRVAFEATCADATVIRNGWAELVREKPSSPG
jgi:acyl dehydratase